jgi:phenylalanyl-tRNA synthetase alpha chain
MLDQLQALKDEALAALVAANDAAALEQWRIVYLGKKGGRLTAVFDGLGKLPPPDRPAVGKTANEVKQALEAAAADRVEEITQRQRQAALQAESVDVTLPARPARQGQIHIISRTIREILSVFVSMGFQVVEGPEVEWDRYNFQMLNIPADHPARDIWDTYYIKHPTRMGEMLLRTHTSPDQARVMERTQPPVRVVVPGKVYRYEATDATHETMFYQIEGLAVDRGITFTDMKGSLTMMARRLFGPDRRVRFRCDYFPFVEPGVDVSVSCHVCDGLDEHCSVCKGSGWLEILGAGMVHPNVLAGVGYDPAVYTGFAFGLGPERVAMLKYGIDDIRLFYENDLRFLRQFR